MSETLQVTKSTATQHSALVLDSVCRYYGDGELRVDALTDVTMHVDGGELVAIMGPSGCGKSTLLNIAGAMDTPNSGTVKIADMPLNTLTSKQLAAVRRRHIGFVFQRLNLIPALTAVENVALPLELDGTPTRKARATAHEALDDIGIPELAKRLPDNMSGGQQQRVAIARALIGSRRIILADEPTGALDSRTGDEVLNVLRDKCDQGAAGVVVTHEARHAAWADRVIYLRDGKVVDKSLSRI